MTVDGLVLHARWMADVARQHARALIDGGLPLDFIEQLDEATDVLADCTSRRGHYSRTQSGHTAAMRAHPRSGGGRQDGVEAA